MDKNFNNTVILSSQTREAVLTFKYDGAERFVVPSYTANASVNSLYINGIDISRLDSSSAKVKTNIDLNSITKTAVFHIYTTSAYDYDLNLRFDLYSSSGLTSIAETTDVSILCRPFTCNLDEFNLYPTDKTIIDNESSYLVVRTNPKFSGNIKLMVDSSSNLYLDTFKVSDILSNKKYRKQQVSANSNLSSDIRKVFNTIPGGEIYKVSKLNTLDIAIPKTSIEEQFTTTYNYGARLLEDDLYSEDYSMLAPLWINSVLPNFFAIFRLNGTHNEDYSIQAILNMAKKYISKSELIKSWSLNEKNNLGKYLSTYLNELKNAQSPVYLPLTEYDHNVWNGISINSGVISRSQETSYQFEKTLDNFTDMNAFISTGFERNNVLCPNLINLEYTFNDETADMYSMHRYFGLYLSENVLYKIAYYKESQDSNSFRIISLDGKDVSAFIEKNDDPTFGIFGLDGNVLDEFNNRIFCINNNEVLSRITSTNQIDRISYVDKFCNKIGSNIFSSNTIKRDISQFISVDINNSLLPGDHFRVINKSKNIIWEIYGIDQIISKTESYKYCSTYVASGYPTIYRNAFSVLGDTSEQIKSIYNAFNLFSEFEVEVEFSIHTNGANSFSIVVGSGYDDDFSFQHITSQREMGANDFTNEGGAAYVNFFGRDGGEYNTVSFDASLGPINFEYAGNRKSIIADFIKTENKLYSLLDDVTDKMQAYMYYQNISGWNKLVQTFDISINSSSYNYQFIKDPMSQESNYMIGTEDEADIMGGKININSVLPINLSLMSINSVKDFDFSVYDDTLQGNENLKSEYFYKRENDKLAYSKIIDQGSVYDIYARGAYLITDGNGEVTFSDGNIVSFAASESNPFSFNTFNNSVSIFAKASTKLTYGILDGSANFIGYELSYNEEDSSSYYVNDSLLKYSLTSPYVTKWVMPGLDCRNNEMRLILNDASINDPYIGLSVMDASYMTNFIPTLDSSIFGNEISIPVFKYLSPGIDSWKDYVYYDINDVITDSSTLARTTIKDAIINNPYVDIFSKMIFSNRRVDEIKNRSSILSYNKYKNSIDTVYSGLKISISTNKNIVELASIENYDRYKFAFISTSSRNYDNNQPIEVFINENLKSILMVWYQGNDILNYYYRTSSFNVGKSIIDNGASLNLSSFYWGKDASNNFAKSPYWLRTDQHHPSAIEIFSNKHDYGYDESSPIVQISHNTNGRGTSFVGYNYDNSVNLREFNINANIDDNPVGTYNNISGKFEYTYIKSETTINDKTINHANIYETTKNLYNKETCDINLFYSLIKSNSIFYNIIRQDKVYNNKTFGNAAFSLSINAPKFYKGKFATHNGGFFPKFNNILNFATNENILMINKTKKDFISSNTNLISYNNIKQLWYNKVVDTVKNSDINGKAIEQITQFNLFKTAWDEDVYTVSDDSSTGFRSINGYESSVELPSFFGSKLIKLPHTIVLKEWDSLNSSATFINNDVILKFNLSLSLRRLFKNEPKFLANWVNLANSSQFIDPYINNTILNYYSINLSSISLKAYSKNTGNLSILSSFLSGMNEILNQNFQSDLIYDKGEYFYVINIKNAYDNISYYVEFEINQK